MIRTRIRRLLDGRQVGEPLWMQAAGLGAWVAALPCTALDWTALGVSAAQGEAVAPALWLAGAALLAAGAVADCLSDLRDPAPARRAASPRRQSAAAGLEASSQVG